MEQSHPDRKHSPHGDSQSLMDIRVIRPHIPDGTLPIALKVSYGDSATPASCASDYRSGDLYLSPTNIWIIQSGMWEQWDSSVRLLLDIDGDERYTSPCQSQGIQLLEDERLHGRHVMEVRRRFSLGKADHMTAAVVQRIRATVDENTAGAEVRADQCLHAY